MTCLLLRLRPPAVRIAAADVVEQVDLDKYPRPPDLGPWNEPRFGGLPQRRRVHSQQGRGFTEVQRGRHFRACSVLEITVGGRHQRQFAVGGI